MKRLAAALFCVLALALCATSVSAQEPVPDQRTTMETARTQPSNMQSTTRTETKTDLKPPVEQPVEAATTPETIETTTETYPPPQETLPQTTIDTTTTTETTRTELPRTASPVPATALLGLFSIGGALALRRRSSR